MTHPIAKILSVFVPGSERRKAFRRRVTRLLYGSAVRRRAKSVGKGFRANGLCIVTSNTSIGDFTSVGGFEVFGGGEVAIGSHVSFGPGVKILTQNHEYEGDALPYTDDKFVHRSVRVGDCAWLGMDVTLLPGTAIGEGAVIQAGSVVHGVIPPCAIAGGNPAKVFAWRDKARYESLKAAGRFFFGRA